MTDSDEDILDASDYEDEEPEDNGCEKTDLTEIFTPEEIEEIFDNALPHSSSSQEIESQPRDNIGFIRKWIARDVAINKRVMRLRAYLYLKVHWFQTSIIWNTLLEDDDYCSVPEHHDWITLRSYLDNNGNWTVSANQKEFERKLKIYNQWNEVTQSASYNAELLYKTAFEEANYTVRRNVIFIDSNGQENQVDLHCIKEGWELGVQIKNITSEVFHDPSKVRNPQQIYIDLKRQFNCCYELHIIPILIAPFIHKSFYDFTDRYGGLCCQTYLQLLETEQMGIANAVKKILRFGNIKAYPSVPEKTRGWISRIPEMWLNHYKKPVT
jgi:hypothetical protein